MSIFHESDVFRKSLPTVRISSNHAGIYFCRCSAIPNVFLHVHTLFFYDCNDFKSANRLKWNSILSGSDDRNPIHATNLQEFYW